MNMDISIIPKSVSKTRIIENISIFDFDLAPEDVAYLDSCNKNQRVSPQTNYSDHKYYPFNIEF